MRVRVRAWVALDDVDLIRETTLPPPSSSFFAGRFVKVDPCVGLTEDDASAAIAMLRAGAEQHQQQQKRGRARPRLNSQGAHRPRDILSGAGSRAISSDMW